MKEYKLKVLRELNEQAIGCRIISVREAALSVGINHLKRQEVIEICDKFLKNHTDYELVRMVDSDYDISSLFCTATLVDKILEFD